MLTAFNVFSQNAERINIYATFAFAKKSKRVWGTGQNEQGVNSSPPLTQRDISKNCSDISLMFVSGNYWQLNHAIQFDLGCAILRGQRAIWLMCKRYYPLSTSYHSLGALIWSSAGFCPDRRHRQTERRDRRQHIKQTLGTRAGTICSCFLVSWCFGPFCIVIRYTDCCKKLNHTISSTNISRMSL